MTEQEAKDWLKVLSGTLNNADKRVEALDMGIKALIVKDKVTEIVDRQLVTGNGKYNYKEAYECFREIIKIVQDNY